MAVRTQRVKGKANEAAGKTKADVGYETDSRKTEAKGSARRSRARRSRVQARPAAP